MRKVIILFSLIVLSFSLFAQYEIGDIVDSNISWLESDGGEAVSYSVQQFNEDPNKKVLMLVFSATSCGPCKEEAPVLETIYQEYSGDAGDIHLVATIGDVSSWDNLNGSDWRTAFGDPLTYWLSIADELYYNHYDKFGNGYIPYNVVIGRDGYVVDTHAGFSESMTRNAINAALATYDHITVLNPLLKLDAMTLYTGKTETIDLTGMFSHPTDAEITVTASSSNPNAVTAEVNGNTLTVTAQDLGGMGEITLTATGGDLTAEHTFNVEVLSYASPKNVTVDAGTGLVSWDAPAMPSWLSYDNEEYYTSIGTGGANDFDAASRWTPEDLVAYNGMEISKIKFFPAEEACDYSVRIWTGANAANLIVDQPVSDVVIGDWNEVILDNPVVINGDEEVWFGYRCNTQTGYPAGCDSGPANAGYGDLLRIDGEWYSMYNDIDASLNFNWLLQAYVTNESGREMAITPALEQNNNSNQDVNAILSAMGMSPISYSSHKVSRTDNNRGLAGYNVYLDGELVKDYVLALQYQLEDLVKGQTYTVGVSSAYNDGGESEIIETEFTYTEVSSDNDVSNAANLSISNYPNPFNPTTTISYNIPAAGNTTIEVFNTKGQKVKTLVNEYKAAGNNSVVWYGRDDNNNAVASGIYFYKISTSGKTVTKKMVMMK